MLIDRIVGAFTFKKGVYASAANDATFTNSAWLIVMVAVLLSQVGSRASSSIGFFHWLLGTLPLKHGDRGWRICCGSVCD